jgi:AcrR family transcriptional regulator
MARPRNFSHEGVLEKAIPVFWEHGFADTGLQELVAATGVNKSGLYSEFSGREAVSGQLALLPRTTAIVRFSWPSRWAARNIEAEAPKSAVHDLASMVVTFFAGLSAKQNLKSRRAAIGRKVDNMMRVLRSL